MQQLMARYARDVEADLLRQTPGEVGVCCDLLAKAVLLKQRVVQVLAVLVFNRCDGLRDHVA